MAYVSFSTLELPFKLLLKPPNNILKYDLSNF